MKLSTILSLILAKTPLTVSVPEVEDLDIESPDNLSDIPVHHKVGDLVAGACLSSGLHERAAYAFGEFIAELTSGLASRYSNENDILALDAAFGQAAYGNPSMVVRLYLLPNWSALSEHIEDIQHGVAAAFERVKSL